MKKQSMELELIIMNQTSSSQRLVHSSPWTNICWAGQIFELNMMAMILKCHEEYQVWTDVSVSDKHVLHSLDFVYKVRNITVDN